MKINDNNIKDFLQKYMDGIHPNKMLKIILIGKFNPKKALRTYAKEFKIVVLI